MPAFRGDAHKIYLHLRKKNSDLKNSKYLHEIAEIKSYYETLESDVLKLVYYRMIKEKNGSGMIPIYVSSIPWLLFLFSSHLEKFLFKWNMYWILFSALYLLVLIISVYLHFREKAWAAFHIEIIQDILSERKDRQPGLE
ncbi:hypothetical protein [Oceanobacillus senegalensis]|uniref:hypothetical protein n=1 Tax=Oceanobacillus senegalensis TaxID=1936063 RepID=UPI000A30848C|nr:hypothetical protein [Oceanobacillus senegalensis]